MHINNFVQKDDSNITVNVVVTTKQEYHISVLENDR